MCGNQHWLSSAKLITWAVVKNVSYHHMCCCFVTNLRAHNSVMYARLRLQNGLLHKSHLHYVQIICVKFHSNQIRYVDQVCFNNFHILCWQTHARPNDSDFFIAISNFVCRGYNKCIAFCCRWSWGIASIYWVMHF